MCQRSATCTHLRRNNISVAEMMCKLVNQQFAPKIDFFGGNPSEFHFFVAVFDEAVEQEIEDSHGKLTYLIKCTTGEVKEMVKIAYNFLQMMDMKSCQADDV